MFKGFTICKWETLKKNKDQVTLFSTNRKFVLFGVKLWLRGLLYMEKYCIVTNDPINSFHIFNALLIFYRYKSNFAKIYSPSM